METSSFVFWAETVAGFGLTIFVLLDVFLTVMYARIGYGIISRRIAIAAWGLFRRVSRLIPKKKALLLSFCGPAILVFLVAAWTILLSLGSALVIHPRLGSSLVAQHGETKRTFSAAMLEGNASLSVISSTGVTAQTSAMQWFFVLNALSGATVLSLTVTYLMQVYTALSHRNTFALKLHVSSAETGDAAVMLTGLAARGKMDMVATTFAEFTGEMAQVKEAHHLYPVLFYFRFPNTLYSLSRFAFVALDATSLLRSVLNEEHDWLRRSGQVDALSRATKLLIRTLADGFVCEFGEHDPQPPNPLERERWVERYLRALQAMKEAGIPVRSDTHTGAEEYVRERSEWEHYIVALAATMEHSLDEVESGA